MKKNDLLKERFIAFLLWSLLLFCFSVNTRAANDIGAPFIQNFFPQDYLANPQNWSAVQDDRGVLYFAINEGILVYYGKHWEIIKVTNKSPVRSLAIDDTGRVYVGATDELGYLTYDSRGKLTYFSLLNLLTNLKILAHNLETMDIHPAALSNSKEVMPTLIGALVRERDSLRYMYPEY